MTTPERAAVAHQRQDDLIASLPNVVPITVDVFREPAHELPGHGWHSSYVEKFWLPTLGPVGVALLRRFDSDLTEASDGKMLSYDLAELSRLVGIADKSDRQPTQKVRRTIARLVNWNMLSMPYAATFGLRPWVRPLFRSNIEHLPAVLQVEHAAYTARLDLADAADRAEVPE